MPKVFLTKSPPTDRERTALDRMLESARNYSGNKHTLVDDPDSAEIILFVEDWETDQLLSQVRHDPVYKEFREKSIVICENDTTIPLLPGIYTSIPRHYAKPGWASAGNYIWMMRESELPEYRPTPSYLYSFVGSVYTHPVRQDILGLVDDRAFLEDTGAVTHYMRYEASPEEKRSWKHRYDKLLAESAFVLCPRGVTHNSVRLFETMRAGRAPIIIDDNVTLPDGPDWDSFSIRVAESRIGSIPDLLRGIESRREIMGDRAREEWLNWFGPQQLFSRHVDWGVELQANRRDGPLMRIARWHLAVTPTYWRDFARHGKRKLLARRNGVDD